MLISRHLTTAHRPPSYRSLFNAQASDRAGTGCRHYSRVRLISLSVSERTGAGTIYGQEVGNTVSMLPFYTEWNMYRIAGNFVGAKIDTKPGN